MAKILLALSQKGDREVLKDWISNRYECVLVDPNDFEYTSSCILEEDFDFAFVDAFVVSSQREKIQKRKIKEYPIILPFVFLTHKEDIDLFRNDLWITVDEVIHTPVKKVELYIRMETLLKYRKMTIILNQLAVTDHLTGFFNYKYLVALGNQMVEQAKRYNRPLSLIFMDIDNFKKVNEAYGSIIGDQVLQAIARRCFLNLRAADIIGRYGGEEFVFILPETPLSNGLIVAERLRYILIQFPIEISGNTVYFSASFGVTEIRKETETINSMLEEANKACSKAKERGGNCVVSYDEVVDER